MKNPSKTLLRIVTIFTAGAALGILFAPAKGEKTRRRITKRGQQLFSNAKYSMEEGKDVINDIKDKLQENMSCLSDELDKIAHGK